jgi:hypothetical protein
MFGRGEEAVLAEVMRLAFGGSLTSLWRPLAEDNLVFGTVTGAL